MAGFKPDAIVFNPRLNNNGCLEEIKAYSKNHLFRKCMIFREF